MQNQKYKISLRSKILIIEAQNFSITIPKVDYIRKEFEQSTGKTFDYVLYKNVLGYYAAYDFLNDNSIYCGSRSENQSIEQIKEYLKDNGREIVGNSNM